MIGTRLRNLRIKKNIQQKELSKILGMSPSAIGMYERNQREPDDATKKKIADFFGVSVSYLIGESNIPLTDKTNKDDVILFEAIEGLEEHDKEIIRNLVNSLKNKK